MVPSVGPATLHKRCGPNRVVQTPSLTVSGGRPLGSRRVRRGEGEALTVDRCPCRKRPQRACRPLSATQGHSEKVDVCKWEESPRQNPATPGPSAPTSSL